MENNYVKMCFRICFWLKVKKRAVKLGMQITISTGPPQKSSEVWKKLDIKKL